MLKFTKRGLIYKTKRSYCSSWEDIFEIEGRDSKDKRKRFKTKYKDLIKQLTYTTESSTGERSNTYMIAHWDLTGSDPSEIQRRAFGEDCEIETSKERNKRVNMPATLKKVYGVLASMVEFQWDGRYSLIDGMVVDLQTGEVVLKNKNILEMVSEARELNKDKKLIRKLEPEDIAWSILVELKSIVSDQNIKALSDNEGTLIVFDEKINKNNS
ncbi:MAG: hypothetical protein ACRCX7_09950 [Cetobacterium sp.]|uniref:hypothetical protein n=1 Tax=Cetobacterium sp. TaxID=2071632 RepID=UPI003F324640